MANSNVKAYRECDHSIIIAGLVWVMVNTLNNKQSLDNVLIGPAVGASLGVYAFGNQPELLVALPDSQSNTDNRLIRRLDPDGGLLCYRRAPPLRWLAEPVIGDTGRWKFEGDPRGWIATCDSSRLNGRTIAFANGNPSAYADLLKSSRPRFVSIDIDATWAPSQISSLNQCLHQVQLVTITRRDYERLPSDVFIGTGVGQRGGAAIVIKSGAAGVSIMAEGKRRELPAPTVQGRVNTDIGAGDLLLGLLTSKLGLGSMPVSLEELESSYIEGLPVVARLLMSNSFAEFADSFFMVRDDV